MFRFFRRSVRRKRIVCRHQGSVYNLKELYDRVNRDYFNEELKLSITWTGRAESKPRWRIMFGSYHHEKKHIKIHRRLDSPHVPEFFISYVIYHEMLHHIHPPIKQRGFKRKIHHSDFKAAEQKFKSHKEAIEFLKSYISAIPLVLR